MLQCSCLNRRKHIRLRSSRPQQMQIFCPKKEKLAKPTGPASALFFLSYTLDPRPSLLLLSPAQLLRRNRSSRAFLVGILDLGPKRARLVLLALTRIKICQVKLRNIGRHCLRRL